MVYFNSRKKLEVKIKTFEDKYKLIQFMITWLILKKIIKTSIHNRKKKVIILRAQKKTSQEMDEQMRVRKKMDHVQLSKPTILENG